MMRRVSGYIFLILLFGGMITSARGQVAPSEINEKLLKKSMQEVLGSYQQPEWHTISLKQLGSQQLELKQIKQLPDSLFLGRVKTGDGIRWILPDFAPSKSEVFSFILYLDESKSVVDVDVLDYRESYGYEIDYPFFRAQFQGKSNPDEVRFRRSIQNISGATISARSITYAVHDLLTILNQIEYPS